MDVRRHLLWVDGSAGLFVGAVVLLLCGWLSELYGLPYKLLFFIGVANVLYGSYSTSLAVRSVRPANLILLLVVANLTWAIGCMILAFTNGESVSLFGLAHLVGEGLFVGCLACLEWRWRELLRTA